MWRKITGPARAVSALMLILFNTLFWMIPLYFAGIFKFLIPVAGSRKFFNKIITFTCNSWNSWNNFIIDMTQNIHWDVLGHENLARQDSYLVLSNHQSWVDILVLEKIFINRIPFLKFFIKQELFWIPVLGFSWWALDYPFMKRYSREFLEKIPTSGEGIWKSRARPAKNIATFPSRS